MKININFCHVITKKNVTVWQMYFNFVSNMI